jgi:hypothetical protein
LLDHPEAREQNALSVGQIYAQKEIEEVLIASTALIEQYGWKAFQHRVGSQSYFCAQKSRYLCTIDGLRVMAEDQFKALLQKKLGNEREGNSLSFPTEKEEHAGTTQRYQIPSVAEFLAQAFGLHPDTLSPVQVPPGTVCAQSGVVLQEGMDMKDILTARASELADIFPFYDTSVSLPAEASLVAKKRQRGPISRRARMDAAFCLAM